MQEPGEKEPLKVELESKQTESNEVQPTPKTPNIDSQPKSDSKSKSRKGSDEDFLGPAQCLDQKYTRWSCSKVFCPPWRRCIAGQCTCKIPYKCPRQEISACTLDGAVYYSMCQANAIACRTKKPVFSHFSTSCKGETCMNAKILDEYIKQVLESLYGFFGVEQKFLIFFQFFRSVHWFLGALGCVQSHLSCSVRLIQTLVRLLSQCGSFE